MTTAARCSANGALPARATAGARKPPRRPAGARGPARRRRKAQRARAAAPAHHGGGSGGRPSERGNRRINSALAEPGLFGRDPQGRRRLPGRAPTASMRWRKPRKTGLPPAPPSRRPPSEINMIRRLPASSRAWQVSAAWQRSAAALVRARSQPTDRRWPCRVAPARAISLHVTATSWFHRWGDGNEFSPVARRSRNVLETEEGDLIFDNAYGGELPAKIAGPLKSFVILASFCKYTIYNCRNRLLQSTARGPHQLQASDRRITASQGCPYRSMVMRCGASCVAGAGQASISAS